MYKIFHFIVYILLTVFNARSQTTLLDSIINPTNAKTLVEYLASDSLLGRFTGTRGARKAAEFISTEFKRAQVKAISGYNGYLAPFLIKNSSSGFDTGYNVLSALEGKTKPNEITIFSAHYDHIGTFSTNPDPSPEGIEGRDSIYNGANDDASGVAAVILLARYFALRKDNERTLLFVTFAGEELNLLGSKALAQIIQPDPIIALINIEMIGRAQGIMYSPFVTGASLTNLKSLLNDRLSRYDKRKYGNHFFIDDPYIQDNLFRRSDNWWFATLGIPAHTIMLTSPHDKFYHSVKDEVETIDFDIMTEVTKAIAIASTAIIDGNTVPKRIKK